MIDYNKLFKKYKKEYYCIMDRRLKLYDLLDYDKNNPELLKELKDCEEALNRVVIKQSNLQKQFMATPNT